MFGDDGTILFASKTVNKYLGLTQVRKRRSCAELYVRVHVSVIVTGVCTHCPVGVAWCGCGVCVFMYAYYVCLSATCAHVYTYIYTYICAYVHYFVVFCMYICILSTPSLSRCIVFFVCFFTNLNFLCILVQY